MNDSSQGLSWQEARNRLARFGPNEFPSTEDRSFLTIIRESVADPLLALLIAAALAHSILGQFHDSIVLIIAVAIVIGLSVRQEWRAENALQALRKLSAPRCVVLREGSAVRITSSEVVVGDLMLLEPGDRVAADAQIQSGTTLLVDESLLTGESVPVNKVPERDPSANRVFAGTMVLRGRAVAEVVATGGQTEFGKLGKSLSGIRRLSNSVEQELARQVRAMAIIAILVCILVSLLHIAREGAWIPGILAGLALAIALVPEEFPVVAKIFLAMAAWRLSRGKVLTRDLGALDRLAHVSVLCVDKTGTLTINQLAVERIIPVAGGRDQILKAAAMASDRHGLDPLDKAVLEQSPIADVNPKDSLSAPMSVVNVYADQEGEKVYAKGAPEEIERLCSMSELERQEWRSASREAALEGLKVIGVAAGKRRAETDKEALQLTPLGLIAFLDPLRAGVRNSVNEALQAGVRILLITGDHAATAKTIAAKAGIPVEHSVSGADLDSLNDLELKALLKTHLLCSRATPDHKHRLVTLLKEIGETVAMTGDGVNDAPALRAADVGFAMGKKGTDVARETADIVLLEDDFPSIVAALRSAREVRRKLRRAVTYIVAIHVPIVGLAMMPFVFGWPLILLPVHIVLLELVVDPACSVVFEAEPAAIDVMSRPVSEFQASLLDSRTVRAGVLHGAAVLLAVASVFGIAYSRFGDELDSRTLAFSTLLLGNVALIWLSRSRDKLIPETLTRPNRFLWIITLGVVFFWLISVNTDFLRNALRLVPLHPLDYMVVVGSVLLVLTMFEVPKLVRHMSAK